MNWLSCVLCDFGAFFLKIEFLGPFQQFSFSPNVTGNFLVLFDPMWSILNPAKGDSQWRRILRKCRWAFRRRRRSAAPRSACPRTSAAPRWWASSVYRPRCSRSCRCSGRRSTPRSISASANRESARTSTTNKKHYNSNSHKNLSKCKKASLVVNVSCPQHLYVWPLKQGHMFCILDNYTNGCPDLTKSSY